MPALQVAKHISISGQCVTFDRGALGWIATGWQQGLPVARKPIDETTVAAILNRFAPDQIIMTV